MRHAQPAMTNDGKLTPIAVIEPRRCNGPRSKNSRPTQTFRAEMPNRTSVKRSSGSASTNPKTAHDNTDSPSRALQIRS